MSNLVVADADTEPEDDVKDFKIKGIIGFDGKTLNGLIVHPDGKHLVYPLGNKVTIQDWNTKQQSFLSGHTNIISAIAVSNSGKYIASGQINHIGFKACVIIWDYEKMCLLHKHETHKVRVEAVVFSKDEKYLISLGGRDCGSVIIWDMVGAQVICGAHVSRGVQGEACVLCPMTRRGACFVTAGDTHLAVWKIDQLAKNATSIDVNTYKLKRNILCVDANERDEFCYCGTTTGDVLKIRLNFHHDPVVLDPVKQPNLIGCFARRTKKTMPRGCVDLYQGGVTAIKRLFEGPIIIGAGDGTLELVEEIKAERLPDVDNIRMPSTPALNILKSTNVNACVTSIQLMKSSGIVLVGTTSSEIYQLHLRTFNAALIVTCHTSTIYDIAFPLNFSEVFATSSIDNVRIWQLSTMQELLRICVPNFACSAVIFAPDGKSIITSWNDGIIRSFTPLTGRLIYAILNAHNKGVSALTSTSDGGMLISGGCEGQVRLWRVSPYRQQLICTLKEHKGPISAIDVNKFNTEAASASSDGTCIIWDLERQCRRQILFGNTMFLCVKYYPSSVQILTGGSDRKIAYWEVLDGCLVREVEGSSTGAINSLDISPDGKTFVTGGTDQTLKLWTYQEGATTHVGVGHAAAITAARYSPDCKYLVSACAAGSIFVWEFPQSKSAEKDTTVEKVDANQNLQIEVAADGEENIKDLPSSRSNGSVSSRGTKKSLKGICECSSTSSSASKHSSCADVCEEFRQKIDGSGDSSKSARSVKSLDSCGKKSNSSSKKSTSCENKSKPVENPSSICRSEKTPSVDCSSRGSVVDSKEKNNTKTSKEGSKAGSKEGSKAGSKEGSKAGSKEGSIARSNEGSVKLQK